MQMYMKLNGNDKKILETLFDMKGGYVLDFSDRTMSNFFEEELDIKIYDEKYDFDFPSRSKANRLRGIFLKEDEKIVGQIILSLVDYLETNSLTENKELSENTKNLMEKARGIGARLLFNEIINDQGTIPEGIAEKTATIKSFNAVDFSTLETNQKIYLLKVLYSYYEAVIRAYYGSGLFFITSGIDDLNDYFKILRKKIMDLIASDDTFLEIKENYAYGEVFEQLTSLYSGAEFLDVIWHESFVPSMLNMREHIADKDLFDNQSEIHKMNVNVPIFLEAISKEMDKMKKYLNEKTKSFYSTNLPNNKEPFAESSGSKKTEDTIRHEHKHIFENSIQEKDIVFNHKYEDKKQSNFYITKKNDDFYYKGKYIEISKKADYYTVFCALYAKLPEGGEIHYKDLIEEVKNRVTKTKNKTSDEMQKFIQRNLTDKNNGFLRYANIGETEDNGKPLLTVIRGSGIYFNNRLG